MGRLGWEGRAGGTGLTKFLIGEVVKEMGLFGGRFRSSCSKGEIGIYSCSGGMGRTAVMPCDLVMHPRTLYSAAAPPVRRLFVLYSNVPRSFDLAVNILSVSRSARDGLVGRKMLLGKGTNLNQTEASSTPSLVVLLRKIAESNIRGLFD